MSPAPVIEAHAVSKRYRLPRQKLFGSRTEIRALDTVDLTVAGGVSYGIVGESGSGKSTLARLIVGLERADAGSVEVLGRRLAGDPRALDGAAQMVFQDPYGSLDPRARVAAIVGEPLWRLPDREERRRRAAAAMAAVGLGAAELDKYPHEFSGGQRQRIAIARALVTDPQILVADEPVSALDVSIRAQVLNLLRDLGMARRLTSVVISHDLAVILYLCGRVAVMHRGRIVEEGPAALLDRPVHPYTIALRDAVPRLEPGRRRHRTERAAAAPEELLNGKAGCAYRARCPRAVPRCAVERPPLTEHAPDHRAACHNPG